MKIIIVLLTAFSFAVPGIAQGVKEKDVPSTVQSAFKARFPQSKAEKWVKEEGNYEAELTLNGKEYEAAFDSGGKWIETEREIKTSALPVPVKEGLANSTFKDWTVKEAVEIESPEYTLAYELELSKGNGKVALYFTPDGKIVKQEMK